MCNETTSDDAAARGAPPNKSKRLEEPRAPACSPVQMPSSVPSAWPPDPDGASGGEVRWPEMLRMLLEPFAAAQADHALQSVTQRVARLLGVRRCTLFLHDARTRRIRLAAAYGLPGPLHAELSRRRFAVRCLPAWVRQMETRGTSMYVVPRERRSAPTHAMPEDGRAGDGVLGGEDDAGTVSEASERCGPVFSTEYPWNTRPVLGIPLSACGELVGFLFCHGVEAGRESSEGSLRFADALAAALGPALLAAMARKRGSADVECQAMERLLAVLGNVGARLHAPEVLEAVVREAVSALHASCGVLALTAGERVVPVVATPDGVAWPASWRLGEGTLGEVAASGVAQRHESASDVPGLQRAAGSVVCVPVSVDGCRQGVLALYGPAPHSFSEADERLLRGMAAYAGVVLQRSHGSPSPNPRSGRGMDLRTVALALDSSLDIDDTLRLVAGMAVEMLGGEIAIAVCFRADARVFAVQAACADGRLATGVSVSLAPSELTARAITSGLPTWVEDGADPPVVELAGRRVRPPVRAGIAVPLRDDGQVTGALLVFHRERREYDADEVRLLTALASHGGAALHHCALYERQRSIADALQRSFAPRVPPTLAGIAVGQRYLPKGSHVGGDFYDLLPISEGRLAVVVGDVSGSGLRAATDAAMARYTARAFLLEAHPPGLALEKLNEALCAHGTGEVFFTAFTGILRPDGQLRYANAAHPYPIVRRAGGRRLTLLETTGTVIGLVSGQRYVERETRLCPGDILVLYTDGVTEAQRRGELFGLERLQAAVRRWDGDDPQALVDHILEAVRAFTGGPLQDDAAALAIRLE